MNLYILRHADAAPLGVNGIHRDEDRPLTDLGILQSKNVARAIGKLNIQLQHIFCSPYYRAKQTAELVAEHLELLNELDESKGLLPSSSPHTLLEELNNMEPNSNVLIVGHQPDLGKLISFLVWGKASVEVPLKKASLASLEIMELQNCAGNTGLQWLMTYDQLVLLSE